MIARLAAALLFLPSLLVAAPLVLAADARHGRPQTAAESRSRLDRLWRNPLTLPAAWSHCLLFCGGARWRQSW